MRKQSARPERGINLTVEQRLGERALDAIERVLVGREILSQLLPAIGDVLFYPLLFSEPDDCVPRRGWSHSGRIAHRKDCAGSQVFYRGENLRGPVLTVGTWQYEFA